MLTKTKHNCTCQAPLLPDPEKLETLDGKPLSLSPCTHTAQHSTAQLSAHMRCRSSCWAHEDPRKRICGSRPALQRLQCLHRRRQLTVQQVATTHYAIAHSRPSKRRPVKAPTRPSLNDHVCQSCRRCRRLPNTICNVCEITGLPGLFRLLLVAYRSEDPVWGAQQRTLQSSAWEHGMHGRSGSIRLIMSRPSQCLVTCS